MSAFRAFRALCHGEDEGCQPDVQEQERDPGLRQRAQAPVPAGGEDGSTVFGGVSKLFERVGGVLKCFVRFALRFKVSRAFGSPRLSSKKSPVTT